MKISDATLNTLFSLLERKRALSYECLTQALGVSRMTAYRIAEALVSKGLLTLRHDTDPLTHRRMKLLTLPRTTPCLILDMQHSVNEMRGYYCNGTWIESVTCTYHHAYGQENGILLNAGKLTETATLLWQDAASARQITWSHQPDRPVASLSNSGICPAKKDALLYALTHHPDLWDKTSVLFLRMGDIPYGMYLERPSAHLPWLSVQGERLLTSRLRTLGWQSHAPSHQKSALLGKCLCYVQSSGLYRHPPQLVFVEEDGSRKKGTSLRLPLSFDECPTLIYRHVSDIPLWVYGGLWQHRRETWLASAQTYIQETSKDAHRE